MAYPVDDDLRRCVHLPTRRRPPLGFLDQRQIGVYRVELAEVPEYRGLAFAERLDQRCYVPRGEDPADAYRQWRRPSNRG